jgi:hypothetical protein
LDLVNVLLAFGLCAFIASGHPFAA